MKDALSTVAIYT